MLVRELRGEPVQAHGEHAELLTDSNPSSKSNCRPWSNETAMIPTSTHYQSHIRSTDHSDEEMGSLWEKH